MVKQNKYRTYEMTINIGINGYGRIEEIFLEHCMSQMIIMN